MNQRIPAISGPLLWGTALLVCSAGLAADLRPGDPLPAVRGVRGGSAGGTIGLDRLRGDAGTLVFFSSAGCPEAAGAYARLESIAETYRRRGFGVVQVSAGDPARGVESMGVPESSFLALFDVEGRIADGFGASAGPEVFLFDPGGRLVYRGAVDDQPFGPAEPAAHYLRDAFAALEAKRPIAVPVTRAVGCSLRP